MTETIVLTDPYSLPWKNTPFRGAPHEQYCRPDELQVSDPKLYRLMIMFDGAFDDYWQYYWNRKKTYFKRRPLWQTNKRIPAESPKTARERALQKKLF